MVNYFDVLNITENAEPEVIKASYKTLAKKYHPDSYTGNKKEAEQKMVLINEAYQILSDEQSRKQYLFKLRENKQSDNGEKNETGSCDGVHKDESFAREQFTHDAGQSNEYYDEKYVKCIEGVARIIWIGVAIVTIISIVSCFIYFGPNLIKTFEDNARNEIEQFLYTFLR